MGRTKTSLEFITKERTRNTTYLQRKKGLIKKGRELAILCNVPVCMIMCPYKEGKQSLSPEVFSFLGDERPKEKSSTLEPNLIDLAQAKDPKKAQAIIERYLAIPEEERLDRSLNLNDMLDKRIKKEEQDLNNLRKKNALAEYPISNSLLDKFTPDQLNELLVQLGQKLEYVNQKIALEKSNQMALVPFVEEPKPFSCLINQVALVPFVEEPKPISCVMNPSENHAQNDGYNRHEMGGNDVNVFNQFAMCNYAMASNIQERHQLVQFYPIVHPDQKPQAGDYGNNSSNMVTYNYYMKMMGTSSVYFDQGSAAAGSVPEASSFYRALPLPLPMPIPMPMPMPMPMPLQLPKPYGVPLPREYQMSDK